MPRLCWRTKIGWTSRKTGDQVKRESKSCEPDYILEVSTYYLRGYQVIDLVKQVRTSPGCEVLGEPLRGGQLLHIRLGVMSRDAFHSLVGMLLREFPHAACRVLMIDWRD